MAKKTTYLCDRCGGIKNGHITESFIVGDNPIHDVGWISLKSKTGYIRDIDLCEKCLKELSDWLLNMDNS